MKVQERMILKTLFSDYQYSYSLIGLLHEFFFTTQSRRIILGLYKKFFKKYKDIPTIDEFLGFSENYLDKENYRLVSNELKRISKYKLKKSNYIEEQILEFLKRKSVEELILITARRLGSKQEINWQDLVKKFEKIVSIDIEFKKVDSYFDSFNNRYIEDNEERSPTLLPGIDKYLGGGLGKSELGVIMAPTNRGKSHFLVFLAKSAVYCGKSVLFLTLEMSEKKIGKRLDSCFSNISKEQLIDNLKIVKKRVSIIKKRFGGDIRIYYSPAYTFSVFDLKMLVNKLNVSGVPIDLIIIDYGDLFKPVNKKEENRLKLSRIYNDLFSLAGQLNIPIWTATQTNRKAVSKKVVTLEDVGEDFNKCKIADVVLTLCQTPQEESENIMRVFFAKNREHLKGKTVYLRSDLATSNFKAEFL